MTIEVDYATYNRITNLAEKLNMDVADLLYNPITDGVLEDYYEDEIREQEEIERDRSDEQKDELVFTRTTVAGTLIW